METEKGLHGAYKYFLHRGVELGPRCLSLRHPGRRSEASGCLRIVSFSAFLGVQVCSGLVSLSRVFGFV